MAHARLDLSDPVIAWDELVSRTGDEATGFPMVNPRRPAESYLLHKLLRDPDGEGLHHIQGDAMPPEGPLPADELALFAAWIAGL